MLPPRAHRPRSRLVVLLPPLLLAAAAVTAVPPATGDAPAPLLPGPRALVIVRTLVMDALGTRTVDTNRARIPFGSRGLLIRRVPYAGPPLSFRLEVLAGLPQETGIPLTLTSEVWSGEVDAAPSAGQVSRREEATLLSAEGSYLLEIEHDPQTGRRIVLSLSAREAGPGDEEIQVPGPPAGSSVQFLLEVMREAGGVADPPDQRVMSSLVGQPITYSSGVRLPATPGDPDEAGGSRLVGVSVTLEAEQTQGELVSVRVELSGAEFSDAARTRLEPFVHRSIQTVPSGRSFEVTLSLPETPSPDGARVRYVVRVTPLLGT